MSKIIILTVVFLSGLLLMNSCSSLKRPDGKNGILQGMIYDFENKPVCGYVISINGEQKTVTDINGRFTVPSVSFGSHYVDGTGKEHCDWNGSIEFNDKTQILYVRVPSLVWLYSKLDGELREGKFQEAKNTLLRFSPEEQKSISFALYSTILNFRTGTSENRDTYFAEAQRLHRELNR